MNIITFKSHKWDQKYKMQGYLVGVAAHSQPESSNSKKFIGIFMKWYDLYFDQIWDDFNDHIKNGCGQPRP